MTKFYFLIASELKSRYRPIFKITSASASTDSAPTQVHTIGPAFFVPVQSPQTNRWISFDFRVFIQDPVVQQPLKSWNSTRTIVEDAMAEAADAKYANLRADKKSFQMVWDYENDLSDTVGEDEKQR